MTVHEHDPIAFWIARENHAVGKSAAEATRRCLAQTARRREAGGIPPPNCTAFAVRGPYARRTTRREFDDAKIYTYLGDDGRWYDAKGEAPCFVAGTPILTPAGPRAIETLRVGQQVVSWDLARGGPVHATIRRIEVRAAQLVDRIELADGRRIDTTANHPFFEADRRRWLAAARWRSGQRMLTLAGGRTRKIAVRRIVRRVAVEAVYSLQLDGPQTYFAAGLLVHNY